MCQYNDGYVYQKNKKLLGSKIGNFMRAYFLNAPSKLRSYIILDLDLNLDLTIFT